MRLLLQPLLSAPHHKADCALRPSPLLLLLLRHLLDPHYWRLVAAGRRRGLRGLRPEAGVAVGLDVLAQIGVRRAVVRQRRLQG